jgi:hypothetical protein
MFIPQAHILDTTFDLQSPGAIGIVHEMDDTDIDDIISHLPSR